MARTGRSVLKDAVRHMVASLYSYSEAKVMAEGAKDGRTKREANLMLRRRALDVKERQNEINLTIAQINERKELGVATKGVEEAEVTGGYGLRTEEAKQSGQLKTEQTKQSGQLSTQESKNTGQMAVAQEQGKSGREQATIKAKSNEAVANTKKAQAEGEAQAAMDLEDKQHANKMEFEEKRSANKIKEITEQRKNREVAKEAYDDSKKAKSTGIKADARTHFSRVRRELEKEPRFAALRKGRIVVNYVAEGDVVSDSDLHSAFKEMIDAAIESGDSRLIRIAREKMGLLGEFTDFYEEGKFSGDRSVLAREVSDLYNAMIDFLLPGLKDHVDTMLWQSGELKTAGYTHEDILTGFDQVNIETGLIEQPEPDVGGISQRSYDRLLEVAKEGVADGDSWDTIETGLRAAIDAMVEVSGGYDQPEGKKVDVGVILERVQADLGSEGGEGEGKEMAGEAATGEPVEGAGSEGAAASEMGGSEAESEQSEVESESGEMGESTSQADFDDAWMAEEPTLSIMGEPVAAGTPKFSLLSSKRDAPEMEDERYEEYRGKYGTEERLSKDVLAKVGKTLRGIVAPPEFGIGFGPRFYRDEDGSFRIGGYFVDKGEHSEEDLAAMSPAERAAATMEKPVTYREADVFIPIVPGRGTLGGGKGRHLLQGPFKKATRAAGGDRVGGNVRSKDRSQGVKSKRQMKKDKAAFEEEQRLIEATKRRQEYWDKVATRHADELEQVRRDAAIRVDKRIQAGEKISPQERTRIIQRAYEQKMRSYDDIAGQQGPGALERRTNYPKGRHGSGRATGEGKKGTATPTSRDRMKDVKAREKAEKEHWERMEKKEAPGVEKRTQGEATGGPEYMEDFEVSKSVGEAAKKSRMSGGAVVDGEGVDPSRTAMMFGFVWNIKDPERREEVEAAVEDGVADTAKEVDVVLKAMRDEMKEDGVSEAEINAFMDRFESEQVQSGWFEKIGGWFKERFGNEDE